MRDDQIGWIEADVTINGRVLTFAESMTLRVALDNFHMFVSNEAVKKDLGL